MNHQQSTSDTVRLRDSKWGFGVFNYAYPGQRSAFWQFIHSNRVPCVRVGSRKIQFVEQQVVDWIDRHSTAAK